MSPSTSYDIFVSYARPDAAWVKGFLLPALGLPAEQVITPEQFDPGAPLLTEVGRAVQGSRYSVLVLSPAYLSDVWATYGGDLASYLSVAERHVRLVPLLLRPCQVPLDIDFRVRLDCTDKADWEVEAARLRKLLNQPEPVQEPIVCPYPGMVPFRPEDARFFKGREAEIQQLVQRLRHQRFLFIVGASGSGKSSLLSAGMLPGLARTASFPPGFWLVRQVRPGARPLEELARQLGDDPDRPEPALRALLAAYPPAGRLLLVVDQFEELFAQAEPTEQRRFIEALWALRAQADCALVLAMRADFFEDLMNSALWPVDPGERLELAPLRGGALRRAIEEPAAEVGVHLEAGLVERLLADAADEPGALPFLQETLVQLWDGMRRRLLPLAAYAELGGEGRGGLAVAVARKADATLADLTPAQRTIARRLFLRLVQFGEGRADTRRQQRVAELRSVGDDPEAFDRTLRHLTDNGQSPADAHW